MLEDSSRRGGGLVVNYILSWLKDLNLISFACLFVMMSNYTPLKVSSFTWVKLHFIMCEICSKRLRLSNIHTETFINCCQGTRAYIFRYASYWECDCEVRVSIMSLWMRLTVGVSSKFGQEICLHVHSCEFEMSRICMSHARSVTLK